MPPYLVALISPILFLLGMFVTLYIKERARQAVKDELTEHLQTLFSEFRHDLVQKLDAVYRRSAECELICEHHENRVESLERNVQLIQLSPARRNVKA